MSTATIERGSKVRVEYEAEYQRPAYSGRHVMTVPGGAEFYAPPEATVTVVRKPLSAEPKVGTIVTGKAGVAIFKRFTDGWWRLRDDSAINSVGQERDWEYVVNWFGGPEHIKILGDNPALGDAPDMCGSTLQFPFENTFGTVYIKFWINRITGVMHMQSAGSLYGSTLPKVKARELAKAILKATGGL